MYGVRTANGCFTRFGQAKESDLSLLLQLRHRTDGLLDRDGRVDPMLIIQADGVDAEPLQRRVTRTLNVFRGPADSQPRAIVVPNVAELRREYDLTVPITNGAADETLIRARAVCVCRIQEIDSEVQSAMDCRDRLRIVMFAIELGHAHAAEAQRGNHGTASPELTHVHDANVFDLRRRSSIA